MGRRQTKEEQEKVNASEVTVFTTNSSQNYIMIGDGGTQLVIHEVYERERELEVLWDTHEQ